MAARAYVLRSAAVERPALIAVAGEALIDLIAEDGVLRPHPRRRGLQHGDGAGPPRRARRVPRPGLARPFRPAARGRLRAAGVDRTILRHSELPTPLALDPDVRRTGTPSTAST